MSTEFDSTVLLERIETLRQQVKELAKGIPDDSKGYKFVKNKLQSALGHLFQAECDLKFTPQEEA